MKRALCYCLFAVALIGSPAVADDNSSGDADAKSTWVTSIAPLGSTGQFVAATANGLLLREASVCSFEAANPSQLSPLYSHPAAVWSVAATSDGSHVASVDYRGNLIVFDTASGEPTQHEAAFERWCQAMIIAPDDKSVVAGNEAGKVMVFDLAAGQVAKSVELDAHAVTGLAISPDGSQLAATDGAGHVHLLTWPGLEPAGKIELGSETAWSVAYVDDGSSLLIGSSDRNLYRCDAKADAKPESVAKGSDWITQLAVSADGQVAAAEIGGRLHFPSSGGVESMNATSGLWALCWNGSGQLLVGTRKDGIVVAGRSWKWTEVKPPAKEETPKAEPKEEAAKTEAEPKEDVKKEDSETEAAADKKAADKKADDKKSAEKPADEKKDAAEKKDAEKQDADEQQADEKKQPAKQADAENEKQE